MLTSDLIGYFDESGTGPDANEVLVVCGYIAPIGIWHKLEKDWARRLQAAGLDPKRGFHRAAFESRKSSHMRGKPENIYAALSDENADDLRESLGGVILDRITGPRPRPVGLGIAVSVVVGAYEAVRGLPPFPGDRYSFCVLQCLTIAVKWMMEQKRKEPIAYVFDDGASNTGIEENKEAINQAVTNIFSDPRNRKDYRFDSLVFRSRAAFPQLQAADFTAWDIRQRYLQQRAGRIHDKRSGSYNIDARHFDEPYIRETLEGYPGYPWS